VGVGICAVGGAGLMLTMGLMRAQEDFVVSHSLADYIDMLCNTHAVVMMLAGTVVACMSYYTGKRMNVHGLEITQRVDRGEAELEAIEEELRDKVDELVDEAAEETKAAIAEADAEVSRHNKLIEQSRYQLSDLELEIDRAEGNFEIELTNLTETNELVRRRGRPRNNTALTRVAPFHKYLSGLLIPTPLERADHTHALQYLEEVRAEAHEQITTRIKTTLIDFDGE
jgi:hypothetical protein